MGKYEIWERRPEGRWISVADATSLDNGREKILRRVRHRSSFRFKTPVPTQFILLPVGVFPEMDSEPMWSIE